LSITTKIGNLATAVAFCVSPMGEVVAITSSHALWSFSITDLANVVNGSTTINNFTWTMENFTAATGSKVTAGYPVSCAVDAAANIYIIDNKG